MFAEVIIKMLLKFEYHVREATDDRPTIVTNDPSRSWMFLTFSQHCLTGLTVIGCLLQLPPKQKHSLLHRHRHLDMGRKSAYFILIGAGAAMEFLLCVRRDFLMIGDRIIKVIKRPLAVVVAVVQIDVVLLIMWLFPMVVANNINRNCNPTMAIVKVAARLLISKGAVAL